MTQQEWEVIIGLEIHAELNTKSKLFSAAPNRFGDEPNTNISPVCTGQPGSLPVLNQEAVRKAVQFGCAINATIAEFSKFDRKSYFYPDSPRNFQITQYEEPIVLGGTVVAEVNGIEKTFGINRVHLEDDAGMLKHFSTFAGVDYNRAGVPLIEIVSEPCIHSAAEASAYAKGVKAILQYLDVSDCNMEEGSLRFDVNISVRLKGEKGFRNKIEIKNLNSFNYMEQAIEREVYRQIKAYSENPAVSPDKIIQQATFRWDPERKETILMRRKEDADDYRYFPEPDLPPIILQKSYITEIRNSLPELPLMRERRYVNTLNLTSSTAFFIASDKTLADYFEAALVKCHNPRSLANWLIVEFAGRYKEQGISVTNSGIEAEHIGELVKMIDQGIITGKIAKAVADEMVCRPGTSPSEIVEKNPDFQPMKDEGSLELFIEEVLKENPQSVQDYQKGIEKAFGFLVGQVMKKTAGKANPAKVNELLKQKIKN